MARLCSLVSILLLLAVALAHPMRAQAHDIPADVLIRVLVRAADDGLQMQIRLPLKALRDVEFPQRGPGYLDLPRAGPALDEAAQRWLLEAFAVTGPRGDLGRPTIKALRLALASQPAAQTWEAANTLLNAPELPAQTQIPWEQVMVDAWLHWPGSAGMAPAALAIEAHTERFGLRVTTLMRLLSTDGRVRLLQLHGAAGKVSLVPGILEVTGRFVQQGLIHALGGLDHLLFIVCLVIPLRRALPMAALITAFTAAHLLALIASSADWLPSSVWSAPILETLIAASVLWLAIDNALGFTRGSHRWPMAFVFGLIHGLGFALGLRDSLQFAGEHLILAVFTFNVGVEIAQLALGGLVLGLMWSIRRIALPERAVVLLISLLIGHTAWHWLIERSKPWRQAIGLE